MRMWAVNLPVMQPWDDWWYFKMLERCRVGGASGVVGVGVWLRCQEGVCGDGAASRGLGGCPGVAPRAVLRARGGLIGVVRTFRIQRRGDTDRGAVSFTQR